MRTPAALALVTLFAVVATAQDAPDASKPVRPPIQFHVLKAWKTDLGDHSIYLNRVAPPSLRVAPKQPQQSTNFLPADAALLLRAEKKSDLLFLSATVFDHKFTEIRWMDTQRQCRAISNTDFNLLSGATFETADTVYSLLLAVDNRTTGADGSAALGTAGVDDQKQTSLLKQLSPTKAQYIVAQDESGATPQEKDLAMLDALHVYYDANRQTLADGYVKREAARIAQEQRPKQPQKPKDTIVNFWPGNGTVIIDVNSKGVKP